MNKSPLHPGESRRSGIRRVPMILTLLMALGGFVSVDAAVKKVSPKKASPKTSGPTTKTVKADPKAPPAPPPDTTLFGRPISDTATVGVKIYEYIAYPTLQLVTWPVQNLLAPGVELLTYPSQEPIRYFLEENVIDRSIELFSAGKNDHIRIYPTISLASGTSSRVGATMRNEGVFGRDTERMVAYLNYFVNGDYKFRTYLVAKELAGTDFTGKIAFSLNRVKNTALYEPDVNTLYFYENRSETYDAQLEHPLFLGFAARGGMSLTSYRNGDSPANTAILSSDFFADENGVISDSSRGLKEAFLDQVYKGGFVRDTRNNSNIPVDGSLTELTGAYHEVGGNHDFVEWRARYLKFFKLGGERYEITAEEEKKSGGLNMDEFIRKLEYQRLRQQFFSRKVVVVQLSASRSYELPGNEMPIHGLQSLGNATPLRGYSGSRFRNYAVVAGTMEYRFPILRIMDGTLFNEYGMFGKAMDKPELDNLRNSWGFGIRVRRPDMFLFRVELAFHGFSGFAINATADAPF